MLMDVRKFRKLQVLVSIVIFISVFFICWLTTGFDLFNIQLSLWGSNQVGTAGLLWNSVVCLLAVSMEFNVVHWIKEHARLKNKKILIILFSLSFLSLFFTGLIPMDYITHLPTAILYFLSLPLFIFYLSFTNRRNIHYKEWNMHLIVSILSAVIPLLLLKLFAGLAIAELAHAIIIMFWNIKINLLK